MTDKYKNKYRIASARLANWDYRWNAAYFITICTKDRQMLLGEIKDGRMNLSPTGEIAERCWAEIPYHFPFVTLYQFIIMPNHVHGIIVLNHDNAPAVAVETLHCNISTATEKNELMAFISPKPGSVSTVIRSYKSAVTKFVRENNPWFSWQARFHDHIIRDEESFNQIRNYIINNPSNWNDDRFCF